MVTPVQMYYFTALERQMSDISISFRGSASRDQRDQALLWLLEGKSALPVVQLQNPLQFLIRMVVTVYRVQTVKKWQFPIFL